MKALAECLSILTILLASADLAIPSCPEAGHSTTQTSQRDVRVIENPKVPSPESGSPAAVELDEELVIGRAGGAEFPVLSVPSAVQADDDGNIYVLDSKERSVKVFDWAGTLRFAFGKTGQGPGEWQRPSRMILIEPDRLLIWDSGNRRLAHYSLRGELIREIPAGKWNFQQIAADRRGHVYADTTIITPQGPSSSLTRFDANFETSEPISSELQKMVPPEVNIMRYKYIFGVDPSGRLYWAWTRDYRIHVLDRAGETVLRIDKNFMPVRTDEEYVENLISRYFGESGVPPGIQLTWLKHFPPMAGLVVDDESRLFVRTFERNDRGEVLYDVFDSMGRLVTRFAHPDNETLCMAKKDKAYFMIEGDPEGLPLVKRYGLAWKNY